MRIPFAAPQATKVALGIFFNRPKVILCWVLIYEVSENETNTCLKIETKICQSNCPIKQNPKTRPTQAQDRPKTPQDKIKTAQEKRKAALDRPKTARDKLLAS